MKLSSRLNNFLSNNPATWQEEYDIALSNIITKARVRKGLTQAELARLAQTTQSSIARAENGAVLPSHNLLKKIANAVEAVLTAPRLEFETNHFSRASLNSGITSAPANTTFRMGVWEGNYSRVAADFQLT